MDTIEKCFCGKCNIEGVDFIPHLIVWEPDGTWRYAHKGDFMQEMTEGLDEKLFNRECLVREGQIEGEVATADDNHTKRIRND